MLGPPGTSIGGWTVRAPEGIREIVHLDIEGHVALAAVGRGPDAACDATLDPRRDHRVGRHDRAQLPVESLPVEGL